MYNKLKKSIKGSEKKNKKAILKETLRRIKKENIMDRGPLQKPSSLKTN